MRKQILLIIILCLSAMMVRAERIDVSTARKVAENVANAGSGLRSAGLCGGSGKIEFCATKRDG